MAVVNMNMTFANDGGDRKLMRVLLVYKVSMGRIGFRRPHYLLLMSKTGRCYYWFSVILSTLLAPYFVWNRPSPWVHSIYALTST